MRILSLEDTLFDAYDGDRERRKTTYKKLSDTKNSKKNKVDHSTSLKRVQGEHEWEA